MSEKSEKIILAVQLILNTTKLLFLPSAIITLSPNTWLSYMRMLEIKNSYGGWIAILFLVSLTLVLKGCWTKIREKNKFKKNFESLNPHQIEVIEKLYEQDHDLLEKNNASVNALEKMGIIISSRIGTPDYDIGVRLLFSYTLTPQTIEFLKKNPDCLNKKDSTAAKSFRANQSAKS